MSIAGSRRPYLKGSFAAHSAMLLIGGAYAQPAAAQPDFSSAVAGWTTSIGGDFIPVPGTPGPMLADPKYPFYTNVDANARGLSPNYRIGDLTNPNLKPPVKAAMKKDNDEVIAGKIAFTSSTSCVPAGVPSFLLQPTTLYFVQTPKEVVMFENYDSQLRHVFLDIPHSANPKPSWNGESVGHYEGDTLVVDTIGQTTKTFVDAYRTPHSEKLHVVERWKLVEDGKALEVAMTVDDPDTYYQPWQATLRYRKAPGPALEAVCAENNLQFDYHMPVAKKPDF
jgi:hypothetical protein